MTSRAGAPALPRVLLVDDDASIRRLVASALGDLAIEFVACAGVEAACAALRERPAVLVITDLMMPGLTGYDLLALLAADPALRGSARLAVFSAGLTANTRARLASLDVWRELDKPVSMRALEDCVTDALAEALQPTSLSLPFPFQISMSGSLSSSLSAGEASTLADRFGGDLDLFTAFRQQTRTHFIEDLEAGRQALSNVDLPALHRLAHSLQGVLTLLGDEAGAARALAVQLTAAAGDRAASEAAWPALAAWLQARASGADFCAPLQSPR